jgi:hypothetical protein
MSGHAGVVNSGRLAAAWHGGDDRLLVGILAAAIGDLVGVEAPRRPRPTAASTFSLPDRPRPS